MNTTKVILIIGLIYVSLSYKDTSTRNMMLIMTGLIMICMLDLKEGLGCCPSGQFAAVENSGDWIGVGELSVNPDENYCEMQWAITYPQEAVCVNCNEQFTCMRSLTDQECIMSEDEGDGTGWYPCAEAGDRHYVDGGLVYPCSPQCTDGYYQSRACTNTSDRVCTQCTDPCGDNYYQSQDCTNTTNRVCTQCTSNCPAGQYKTRDCTDTQDITCEECPIIPNSSNAVTVTCDDGDGGNSRIADGPVNRCIDNHYYNTANNTCDQCSTCSPGQYISQECGESTDRECSQCTPIENSSPGITVTCDDGDGGNSRIEDGSGNRCIEGYYYNNIADTCEPDYKTCLQLKTDNPTLACPEGVEEVSNHDTKIVHGVPSRVGGIQSNETNYHHFCCESIKYTCAELHSDNESDRPLDDNKLECTSGEFDIANSSLVSIIYDNVTSHDDQRKQDLFDIACCGEADIHFSDRDECVCGENGDTPNNIACIPVDPTNIFGNGEPTLPPELHWVTADGSLSRVWSQADILCSQGLINSYCARNTDNNCTNPLPNNSVHSTPPSSP